jgi:hypothetical protein
VNETTAFSTFNHPRNYIRRASGLVLTAISDLCLNCRSDLLRHVARIAVSKALLEASVAHLFLFCPSIKLEAAL